LLDRERNLRGVGNFHHPSLASTNVTQQADRIGAGNQPYNAPHCGLGIWRSTKLLHRAVGAKHLRRYLGAVAWRFNWRFGMKSIHERLAVTSATPMPHRLPKLAEALW
jgi:hypothetical protein